MYCTFLVYFEKCRFNRAVRLYIRLISVTSLNFGKLVDYYATSKGKMLSIYRALINYTLTHLKDKRRCYSAQIRWYQCKLKGFPLPAFCYANDTN